MALFTGKNDKDIPYLTSFYQVDPVSGYEEKGRGLLCTEMHEYLKRDWEKHELTKNTGQVFKADAGIVAGYVYLHMAVAQIMDAMADRETDRKLGIVDVEYLTYIQERFHYLAANEILMTPELHHRTKKGGLVWKPLADYASDTVDIGLVTFEIPHDYRFYTERFILEELRQLLTLHLPVHRCYDCTNPFVQYRKSRLYCSYRCAARAGARARRAFEKDVL